MENLSDLIGIRIECRFIEDEKLSLKDRKYICPICGMIEDRDINAAKNTYNLK